MSTGHEISPVTQQLPPTPAGAWSLFWQSVVRVQAEKLTPWLALRNAVGVTLPLAAGMALGSISIGLAMSTGALNVSFSDSEEPYARRAGRMLAASLLVGLAVFAGVTCGANYPMAVLVAGVWAFAAGMAVALSQPAADLGTISLVTLLVYSASPMPLERALSAGLLALAGGLLQTLLALIFWPVRRRGPERRALADLYLTMAQRAALPASASASPPASAEINEAHSALAGLKHDHSVPAERFRLLLSQAERMRLGLLTLARLRARMQREAAGAEQALVDGYLVIFARLLGLVGQALNTRAMQPVSEFLTELETATENLRQIEHPASAAIEAMILDARTQMEALNGQMRAALELTTAATDAAVAGLRQRETRTPVRLRLSGAVATLRANLSFHSAACRHAIRLAVCVALGEAASRSLGLQRSYWLPMTIAIVLKPDFTATFTRGVLRLAGTFAGLILATVFFHLLPPGMGLEVAMIAILMFTLRWVGSANYGIFVAAVTALVVFLIALTGVAPKQVMAARGLNTVLGGIVALLAYWLWPTWERTQVSELLAQLLDAYRDYFRHIREAYTRRETSFAAALDRTREKGRLARSNLEASIDRVMAEPGTSPQRVTLLTGLLASSHRLAHAMMALEAGLSTSPPAPARQAFDVFANDVELVLYYLSAALRGSPITRDMLPDLREDHHALLHAGDAGTGQYALVNVETDRITNSLNTLSSELWPWLEAHAGAYSTSRRTDAT